MKTCSQKRLLLILSPERSGSTLLSVLLGGHRDIIAPPEMHLFAYPDFRTWYKEYPIAMESMLLLTNSLGFSYDKESIIKTFEELDVQEIYNKLIFESKKPNYIIVDKTPRYSREIAALRRAETLTPFYIWLIRHPLGVAVSQISLQIRGRRSLNNKLLPRIKYPAYLVKNRFLQKKEVLNQVAYWVDIHKRIKYFLERIPEDRYLVIQFEDLVRKPEDQIKRICMALGIDFEESMVNPQENIPSTLKWGLGDYKIHEHKRVDPNVAFKWKSNVNDRILGVDTVKFMSEIGVITS